VDPNLVCGLLLLVATMYSLVGHGGASGYLAILSLAGLSVAMVSSSSLVLNLFVAGTSFAFYSQAKNFSWKLTWPFLLLAIPGSYVGALVRLTAESYSVLLGVVLVFAAGRLVWNSRSPKDITEPEIWLACLIGAIIGVVSGMVGVGGGIFLSPVILLMSWADPKTTAATSSIFIFANSLAGLAGRGVQGSLAFPREMWIWIFICLVGAMVGGFLGSRKFTPDWIRYLLGMVLLTAAYKLLFE
jgi:uncharacterized membrane protein YfcA